MNFHEVIHELHSPTENKNARERFLTFVRNDNACHLEPFEEDTQGKLRERSFFNPIFKGGAKYTKIFVFRASATPNTLRTIGTFGTVQVVERFERISLFQSGGQFEQQRIVAARGNK